MANTWTNLLLKYFNPNNQKITNQSKKIGDKKMVQYKIELVIIDDRFTTTALGSNTTRQTIKKGQAINLECAIYEAECICGQLEPSTFPGNEKGRKYIYKTSTHTLHTEHKYSSTLVVTYRIAK